MERNTRKICALLESSDNMRRCAAAIVLAELAPKDKEVVAALGTALETANQTLTPYLLAAMEAIGGVEAARRVIPLLDTDDMETKLRAMAVISTAGSRVLPAIKERMENAPTSQKRVLIDLLARIHTSGAFRSILQVLLEPDPTLAQEACEAVHRHVGNAKPAERTSLHKQVVEFMQTDKASSRERVQASCLLLIGHLGAPGARAILLKHAKPAGPPAIRRQALIGLKNLDLSPAAAAAVGRSILPYLGDKDEGVVRHALDVLDRLPSQTITQAQAKKLLNHQHAAARAFAARKFAESDTAAANRVLLSLFKSEDTQLLEIAAHALASHEKATPLLLEAMLAEKDVQGAWLVAKVLKSHGAAVKKRDLEQVSALALRELKAGSPRFEPLLHFLREASPGMAHQVLREAGLAHKKAKRWAEAVDCLRRLTHTEVFDEDLRYALTLCGLKLSPKILESPRRAEDHAIRGMQSLVRSAGFDLLAKIRKDKTLEAADVFYVGFHFSESPGRDGEFGKALLQHLVKTWPRSEEAKAARNKLKPLSPPPKPRATRKHK